MHIISQLPPISCHSALSSHRIWIKQLCFASVIWTFFISFNRFVSGGVEKGTHPTGHIQKDFICNFVDHYLWNMPINLLIFSLFCEQIPRNGLWFCHQTSWYQYHDPYLSQYGHYDGRNWWPEQIYDSVLSRINCVYYPVHWRICVLEIDLPQILLSNYRLEHLILW